MANRKTHWEGVYYNKSPLEVSWYQQRPVLSLKLIHAMAPGLDAAIIDVGGGASQLVDKLIECGFDNVAVLDVSANALAHARARLGDRATIVKWYEADVTAFEPPQQYQLWHDRAVFHFLTEEEDRVSYVETMRKTLLPGGHVIIMTFAVGGPQKCSGLDIVQYDVDKLRAELGPDFKMRESGHETHETPAGNEQKFAWFRLIYRPA